MAANLGTPQCWSDAETVLKSGARRVLLFGIPGTGKTFAARHAGVTRNKKVYNIYIEPETPAIDIIGHDVIKDGEMPWRDGPAIRAWRQGARLVVNEIDKASDDCLTALLAICDDEESAGIELPTGEYVQPKAGVQIVATMNGDLEDLPEALVDRFIGAAIRIDMPHPEAIKKLPQELQQLAVETTHAGIEEERRITIRQYRGFTELLAAKVPEDVAARVAFRGRAGDILTAMATARLRQKTATTRAKRPKVAKIAETLEEA